MSGLTFRRITSQQPHDSHPHGVQVNYPNDDQLTSFWYDTTKKADNAFWAVGNMRIEIESIIERLLEKQ